MNDRQKKTVEQMFALVAWVFGIFAISIAAAMTTSPGERERLDQNYYPIYGQETDRLVADEIPTKSDDPGSDRPPIPDVVPDSTIGLLYENVPPRGDVPPNIVELVRRGDTLIVRRFSPPRGMQTIAIPFRGWYQADVDCDGRIDVVDLIRLIEILFGAKDYDIR